MNMSNFSSGLEMFSVQFECDSAWFCVEGLKNTLEQKNKYMDRGLNNIPTIVKKITFYRRFAHSTAEITYGSGYLGQMRLIEAILTPETSKSILKSNNSDWHSKEAQTKAEI